MNRAIKAIYCFILVNGYGVSQNYYGDIIIDTPMNRHGGGPDYCFVYTMRGETDFGWILTFVEKNNE